MLRRRWSLRPAFLGFFLVEGNARIWIADSSTGKKSLGITVSIDDADATSLLAIRAVDLLRASLRDFERADGQDRPSPAVLESGSPSTAASVTQPGRWSLPGGMDALRETSELGLGWAAHLGAARWFSSRLALGLEIVVPVTAQSYSVSSARAHLRGYWGLVALRWRAWAGPRLSLDLAQALGADYLSVRGEAQSPWSGQSTSTWTAASWTGACLDFALSRHTGLMVSLAAVFLLPRPTLENALVPEFRRLSSLSR